MDARYSYLSRGLGPRGQYPTTVALQPIRPAQLAGLPSESARTPPLPPLRSSLVSRGPGGGSLGLVVGGRGSPPVGCVRYTDGFTAEGARGGGTTRN